MVDHACPAPGCGFSSRSPQILVDHQRDQHPALLRCAIVHVDLFDSVVACGDTFDSTEDLETHVFVKHRVNLRSDPPPLRFQGDLSRFRNFRITWRSSDEITAEGVDAVQDLRPNVRVLTMRDLVPFPAPPRRIIPTLRRRPPTPYRRPIDRFSSSPEPSTPHRPRRDSSSPEPSTPHRPPMPPARPIRPVVSPPRPVQRVRATVATGSGYRFFPLRTTPSIPPPPAQHPIQLLPEVTGPERQNSHLEDLYPGSPIARLTPLSAQVEELIANHLNSTFDRLL